MTTRVVRLWWRCTLCRWRVDTFGLEHDAEDHQALAHDDRVHDHLARRHQLRPDSYTTIAELFEPAGATTRIVKHAVLVPDLV